jgi:hypothetical protein
VARLGVTASMVEANSPLWVKSCRSRNAKC